MSFVTNTPQGQAHSNSSLWGHILQILHIEHFFGDYEIGVQVLGSVIIPAWAFATMALLFLALKALGILRVSPEDEAAGLDITEHGMHAYPPSLVVESTMSPAGAPIPVSSGDRA